MRSPCWHGVTCPTRPLAEAVKLAVTRRHHSRDRWQRDDRGGPGQESYEGSEQNGIKSSEYGKYDRCFALKK
jgi:hypothetical protein